MLEIKNISAGYRKHTVIDGVSGSFEKGKLTGIIGVNGSGKSTLVKAVSGILPVSQGEIIVDGQNLRSMKRNEVAKKIAYLSQGRNTPDMTVEQMVLHGRFPYLSYPRRYTEHDRALAEKAMDAAGVSSFAQSPLYTLSGGMRQNVYIAMALAQGTDYILLDEPTTYLDIAHQLELMKLLRELAQQGKGIVAVMHDLPMAFEFSDEIMVVDNGRTVMISSPDEICASSVIEDVFGVQVVRLGEGKRYCYGVK